MGHPKYSVFGLLLSLLATQYDPVDRVSAEAKCASTAPLVTALPTGPSGCTLADTQKGIQAALSR
jgi:hypothetical protein